MVQPVTLTELKVGIRELADEESSSSGASSLVSDPELTRRINEAVRSYYNLLLEVQGHEYFAKDKEYDIIPDVSLYELPLDFFQALRVRLRRGTTYSEILTWSQQDTARFENSSNSGDFYWMLSRNGVRYRIQAQNIELIPTPTVSECKLQLRYTPTSPVLGNDDDTIDSVNGWHAWVQYKVAIWLMVKGESDPTELRRELAAIESEIRAHAPNRDIGRPEVIQDTMGDDPYSLNGGLRSNLYGGFGTL
jgi:hypothetical protein